MLAILRQLQSYQINPPLNYNEGQLDWFTVQHSVNIASLIEDHKWLAVQYSTHCALLMKDLSRDADVAEQIRAALMMSALLEHIYACYLYETDGINLMHRHQHVYRQLLVDRQILPEFMLGSPTLKLSFSKVVHDLFTTANRQRLCTVRVRRLLIMIMPFASELDVYCSWVGWMEQLTGPAVVYLAWFTLFPRLLKNVLLILKHLIPHSWMTPEEYELGWTSRLIAQVELHWFELANDMATVSVGLLNCFVLTGALNIYLGFSLFVFDVALASLRAYIDIRYLKKLEAQYLALPENSEIDIRYIEQLKERIHYEESRLALMVETTCWLLLAATFSIPIIAVHPILPLIGAIIAVLATINNIRKSQAIELQKPNDTVQYKSRPETNRYALFQPEVNGSAALNHEKSQLNGNGVH